MSELDGVYEGKYTMDVQEAQLLLDSCKPHQFDWWKARGYLDRQEQVRSRMWDINEKFHRAYELADGEAKRAIADGLRLIRERILEE